MSDWIVRLIEQSGYLGVGFLMFLETVFPPIPSEVIMSVAGVAAGQGKLDYWGVVAAGTAGAMLGNILWYLAARALGIQRLEPIVRRWGRWITMSWAEVKRAERWFSQHGTRRPRCDDAPIVELALSRRNAGHGHDHFRRDWREHRLQEHQEADAEVA